MHSTKPIVWTIAGSDSSAGSGIQADLQTFAQLGVHGCSVITLVSAQNGQDKIVVQCCSAEIIAQQIQALEKVLPAAVIKIGALGNKETIILLADYLTTYSGKVVCDPVLIASSGGELLDDNAVDLLKTRLFARIDLLTPNIVEAEKLLNCCIDSPAQVEAAAQKFLDLGVKAVLIKGGHLPAHLASDYFLDAEHGFWLHSQEELLTSSVNKNVRGSGCVLSSAISAAWARGYSLDDALVIAKMLVNNAIRTSVCLNDSAKVNYMLPARPWPRAAIDLPWISAAITAGEKLIAYPSCGPEPIGFYPIIDSIEWLELLLQQGVRSIQLRIKDQSAEAVESTIKAAITLAKSYAGARLFINDYWQLAIKYQAYGVHLGQQDLQNVDSQAIQAAGLRLGISTHCYYEVAMAISYQPSYIAFGPVYETFSKKMCFSARGLEQLAYWQKLLNYPVVAIGGINLQRLPAVLATGVDGVAVISAVTKASDPKQAIAVFLEQIMGGSC